MKIELTSKHKIQFYIENDFLIVRKRGWFKINELKKIKQSSIKKLEFKNPYADINPVLMVFYYVFAFVVMLVLAETLGKTNWKKQLLITYSVNGDEGVGSVDVNLSSKDLNLLKKAILVPNNLSSMS